MWQSRTGAEQAKTAFQAKQIEAKTDFGAEQTEAEADFRAEQLRAGWNDHLAAEWKGA